MLLVFRQSLATPETMLPFKIVTTRSTHFITTPAVVASSIINIIIVFLIVIIVATSMTPSASGAGVPSICGLQPCEAMQHRMAQG